MLNVKVVITGDKQVEARLSKLGPKLTDFQLAMRTIGQELKSFYSGQVFASQGGAIGKTWRPLSPSYRLYKVKHYPGRGINIRTGYTQRSFYYNADSKKVVIGNESAVFPYLQLGTSRMPARPMMGVNDSVRQIIAQIIETDVRRKIDGAM